jgi:hypothetical protein
MDVCSESVLPSTRNRLATALVQSGNEDHADSGGQKPQQTLEKPVYRRLGRHTFVDSRIVQSAKPMSKWGNQMKFMLFILVAQIHAGGAQTVAVYPSLEQCRDALSVAASNVAADYSCAATPVQGKWSPKDARYLMARE